MPIQRSTCFKIKSDEDIPHMLEAYKTVEQDNERDGKRYILSAKARQIISDPRNGGYNFIALTTFASMDDVKFYDEQCEAHKKLKDFAKEKVGGPPLVLHFEI
ncbi:hypothetical protein B0A50_00074 [Salinomyces thailandicus]|uniref:Stress-response A/B barrel domain-containing protein n=1 Tax=Salinomyces thailandicus TaxID=706561 RepID=A0A4U0UF74_9PEZI|nr:hypothetical protein B0A50_00074 [Salinomyces thailandica]